MSRVTRTDRGTRPQRPPRLSAFSLARDKTRKIALEPGSEPPVSRKIPANGDVSAEETPRILLVDDDPTTRNLISHFLRKERISVARAAGANETLTLAKAESPDLLIIDFVVQGMGGVELLTLLKASPETASIPVIILFPFDEEEDIVKALEAGGDFIRKPFSPRILVAKVKKILKDAKSHAPDRRRL
jgi:CheY-like chemotaxis protein